MNNTSRGLRRIILFRNSARNDKSFNTLQLLSNCIIHWACRTRKQNGGNDNNDSKNNKKKKTGVPGLKEGLLDGGVPKGGRAELEKSIVLFQMQ